MGHYINPPLDVLKIGRELKGEEIVSVFIRGSVTFKDLSEELKDDEILIELYDRYCFLNAVWLYSEKEMMGFEGQANNGQIRRIGFFAVPKEEAAKKGISLDAINSLEEKNETAEA